jgi:hypothetical protein
VGNVKALAQLVEFVGIHERQTALSRLKMGDNVHSIPKGIRFNL